MRAFYLLPHLDQIKTHILSSKRCFFFVPPPPFLLKINVRSSPAPTQQGTFNNPLKNTSHIAYSRTLLWRCMKHSKQIKVPQRLCLAKGTVHSLAEGSTLDKLISPSVLAQGIKLQSAIVAPRRLGVRQSYQQYSPSPLAATSVATRMLVLPDRKSEKVVQYIS